MAMLECDGILKKLGLKNVRMWEYGKFNCPAILQKGKKGKEVDKMLSDLIKKLKTNGKYQKIMSPILDQKFEEWQP